MVTLYYEAKGCLRFLDSRHLGCLCIFAERDLLKRGKEQLQNKRTDEYNESFLRCSENCLEGHTFLGITKIVISKPE